MRTFKLATLFATASAFLVAGCATGNGMDDEVRTQQRTADFSEWDRNNNGVLDRDEFGMYIGGGQMYATFDEDGDGEIGEEEFSTGLHTEWDADASGTVSRSEFDAGIDASFGDDADTGAWEDWDADGDSELDANEMREGLEYNGLYDNIDQDNDAIFDDEEFSDFFFDAFDFNDDDEVDTTEWDDFAESGARN